MVTESSGGDHGAVRWLLLAWWGCGYNFSVQKGSRKINDGE